jgi:hypothetical protein
MASESLYAEAQRGNDAAMVLENLAYREAMDRLKADVVQAWKKCPVRDREGQMLYLQLAKMADKFDAMLSGMVEGGKFAQAKIALDDLRNEGGARRLMRRVL